MASKYSKAKPPADPQTVCIVFKGKRSEMSKAQRAFLKTKNEIERLRQELADTAAKLEQLLVCHSELVAPHIDLVSDLQKKLIETCASVLSGDGKPPKKTVRKKLVDCILELFDSLFVRGVQIDTGLRELYDSILETYYPEEEDDYQPDAPPDSGSGDGSQTDDNAFYAMKEHLEMMFFAETGETINLDGLRPDMNQEEVNAHIRDLLENHPKNPKNRKKTKRQLEKEEQEKQAEATRAKNINAVYRQLARLFHPDLEQDPDLKAKKEILMKELTAAYEKGDLHTILGLELRWLQNNDGDITRLSDIKLDAYTAALKQQCADLRAEIHALAQSPRFNLLRIQGTMWRLPLFTLTENIRRDARDIRIWAKTLKQNTATLNQILKLSNAKDRDQALNAYATELFSTLISQTDAYSPDLLF